MILILGMVIGIISLLTIYTESPGQIFDRWLLNRHSGKQVSILQSPSSEGVSEEAQNHKIKLYNQW